MKGLWILALILLAVASHFVLRGLPAYRGASEALADLRQRTREMQTLFDSTEEVSQAEVNALARDSVELGGLIRQRRETLLDASLSAPLPDLAGLLASSRLSALDPLRDSLLEQGGRSIRSEAALARIVSLLEGFPSVNIRTLELGDGGAGAEPALTGTGLLSFPVDLVLVGGLSELIEVLESFAPGQGEPIVWVRRAGLQRIEPSGWSSDGGQDGPPVRLSVSALVLFAATASEPVR